MRVPGDKLPIRDLKEGEMSRVQVSIAVNTQIGFG